MRAPPATWPCRWCWRSGPFSSDCSRRGGFSRKRLPMKEVRTLHVGVGEDGVRLDRWFKRRWPHLNHIQIQKLVRSGQIRVDGARAKADTRLTAGAMVRVPPLPDAPDPDEKKKQG